ncbi:transcription termination factor MTEF [Salix suchowensis]|nr:transcription termination factor MTEF [Salix suchowensis]
MSLFNIAESPRFFRTKRVVQTEHGQSINPVSRTAAQTALLEYLYVTRNIQFTDADSMSKNSPHFLEKLLAKVDIDADIGQSITRFLCFHPINEFEPFFESLGLKPHDYNPLLPRDLMFLCDDGLLLQNYHVLCNYGIARSKIGKIYKEATEVFGYDYGVLALKLKAYEELGLSQSFMIKLVVCSPYLLIGEVNADFIKVLEILRKQGVEISRIEEHLSEKSSYDWSKLLSLLILFGHAGYNGEQLGGLISQHLGIFFEDSVDRIYLLIGFLLKFGSTMNQICSMFLQFPQMKFEEFFSNLRNCFLFLNEIRMEAREIQNIFYKRMCKVIQENPQVLKKWVMGSKVERLPNLRLKSRKLKTKFLLDLGIVDSNEIGKAVKVFRGSGEKFQERFDCIVEAGFSRKDVCGMIKASPQILNQTKDVLEKKIDFLVNNVGYPVSYLVTFPSYLNFTTQRVELRLAMYNWLKDQGKSVSMLSLRSLISLSDKRFIDEYVNSHPRGPQIWQDLKKEIYDE